MDDLRAKLTELGLSLPPVPSTTGNAMPAAMANGFLFINQLAVWDGKILHPGKVPVDLSLEHAQESARVCALNVLAVLNKALGGDLSRLGGCVQVTGFVACAPLFSDHAKVIQAASDVFVAALGDRGRHTCAPVGVPSLPLHSPVQLQVVFAVEA